MAKTNDTKKIHPATCVRVLAEYNERLSMLFNILPHLVEFARKAKTDNAPYRDGLLKMIDDHLEKINEFRNAE